MNNKNNQAQAKSHAGRNDKLGINFAWPYILYAFYWVSRVIASWLKTSLDCNHEYYLPADPVYLYLFAAYSLKLSWISDV